MNWELMIGGLALVVSIFGIAFTIFKTRKADKDIISQKYQHLLSKLFRNRNKLQHSINRLGIMRNSNKKEVQNDLTFIDKIDDTILRLDEWIGDLNDKVKDLMNNYPEISMEELDKAGTSTDVAVDIIEIAIKQVEEIEKIFKKKN